MFKQRPLTFLLIVATLAVDVTLMATGGGSDLAPFSLGMVLGQIAVLAIWSVRGQMHRLARHSLLVIAIGLLTYLIYIDPSPQAIWLSFYTVYALGVILVTAASDYLRYLSRIEDAAGESARRWQFPLIEFFGWTTIVAIVSFGARHMNFEFLREPSVLLTVASLFLVPLLIPPLVHRDLRELRSFKALLIVLAMIIAAVCVHGEQGSGASVIFVQTAYITLWLTVVGMDDVLTRVRRVSNDILNAQAANASKLFDPED